MALYLPPEIWALIVGHLSPGKVSLLDPGSGKKSAWHGSLANLCLASKMHRDLATPRLYECPMTRNTEAFIRTLFERPDLASYVKCLCHGTWNDWSRMSAAHIPAFTNLLLEHIARIKERLNTDKPPAIYVTHALEQMFQDASENNTEPQVNDAVALSLLPGLECIHLASSWKPVCASSAAGSLPYLRQVVVTSSSEEDPIVLPPQLAYLTLAAPNLSALRVDYLPGFAATLSLPGYMPVFPNVTTLDLRHAVIEPAAWSLFLKAFPRLIDLRCEPDREFWPGFCPRQFQDILVKVHPRIKRLHFDNSALYQPERSSSPTPHLSDMSPWSEGLAELRELEYFVTDAESLIDGAREDEIPTEKVLTSVLPKSLRKLGVLYSLPSSDLVLSGVWDALEGLVKATPDGFPLLTSVAFENANSSPLFPDVVKAFAERGIVFEEVIL